MQLQTCRMLLADSRSYFVKAAVRSLAHRPVLFVDPKIFIWMGFLNFITMWVLSVYYFLNILHILMVLNMGKICYLLKATHNSYIILALSESEKVWVQQLTFKMFQKTSVQKLWAAWPLKNTLKMSTSC